MNVRLFINGISRTPLKVKLKKEGERSIDQIEMAIPQNIDVSTNHKLLYLQDMVSLNNLSAIYNFQGNVKDESGNDNHGTSANITYVDGQWDGKHSLFNGTSSVVTVLDSNDFDFDGKFDILIWCSWSSTSQEYILSKRSSTSNGLSISVNGTTAGDITVNMGGSTITSSTAGYNNGNDHLIRLVRDGDNLTTLYIDNISKGSSTISYDTTDTNSLIFGRDYSTGYFTGELGRIRIYKDYNLSIDEASNIYTKRNSRSTMKFGGFVTKIENKTTHNEIIAQSYGKILAETEVRGTAYDNQTPEYIVEDLITNNTSMEYIGNGGATGLTLTKFTAAGKLIDIIKDFASLTNRMFYTTGNNQFIFEPIKFNDTSISFTHGVISKVLLSGYDDTELVNDLTVLGENLRYRTIENFSGDGSTKIFSLNFGAVTTYIKVGGVEKSPEVDYTFDSVGKTITFDISPVSGSNNIEVDYIYEQPLFIRGTRQSSIDTYGTRAKRLNLSWINNRSDGVRFVQSYLNRYKEVNQKIRIDIGNIYNSISENDIVEIINTNNNISGDYVVKSVEWSYPEFNTVLNVGEYYFDYFEYDKDIVKKLHDVEGALTTIKEVRDYESPEEILGLSDIVIQIIVGEFTETLNMSDTTVIYDKTAATYGIGTYGSRTSGSVYSST
jgi:hypothetical protein